MSDVLARALLEALDEDALDALADRLAPRIVSRLAGQQNGAREWLRGADAIAAYIDAPVSRVYSLHAAGRMQCVAKDGSALVAKRSELDEWVKAGGAKRA